MADRELERPLSPELVLVSPDLRERALLDEPDVPLPPEADFDPPQAYVAPPTASVPPAPPVEVPSPPPVPPPAQAAGPIARRLTAGTATAIALAALIVFGAGLAIGKFAFPPRRLGRRPRCAVRLRRLPSPCRYLGRRRARRRQCRLGRRGPRRHRLVPRRRRRPRPRRAVRLPNLASPCRYHGRRRARRRQCRLSRRGHRSRRAVRLRSLPPPCRYLGRRRVRRRQCRLSRRSPRRHRLVPRSRRGLSARYPTAATSFPR